MIDLSEVTPEAIRAALAELGYTIQDAEGKSGDTWVDEEDRNRPAVLVPREAQAEILGYESVLAAAVERLSWVLELSADRTVERLTERGDRFELRIVDESTIGGRLPVLRAPDVVHGFLQVLRGGARAEFRGARATYAGTDPEDVNDALAGISLVPPRAGSFRLLAVSSTQAQLPLDRDQAEPDKARRAVAAAMRALYAAAEVTRDDPPEDPDELLPAVDSGVSATVLQGLEDISRGMAGAEFEFDVHWDPLLPRVDVPAEPITLGRVQINRLPLLTEQLRRHEPQENQNVSGWIKTASADELAEEGRPAGYVIVETRIHGKTRDLRVELPSDLFPEARAGASLLTANGTLERIAGRWHLTSPTSIRIR